MRKITFSLGMLLLTTGTIYFLSLAEVQADLSVNQSQIITIQHSAPLKKVSSQGNTAKTILITASKQAGQVQPAPKMLDLQKTFPNLKISGLSNERLPLVQKVFAVLPSERLQSLTSLQFTQIEGQRRGLGGSNTVIINDFNLSEDEFVSVLVHELGHVIDLGGFTGSPLSKKSAFNDGSTPIYTNDQSVVYYSYSWNDSTQRKQGAQKRDFVSGYAMTDPFEDFAETLTYYTLHNQEFQKLASRNNVLQTKYGFIKQNVFNGAEPQTGSTQVNITQRIWDVTKLAINF